MKIGKSVKESVIESVWAFRDLVRISIVDSVSSSVMDLVWHSVRKSVWVSVWLLIYVSVRSKTRI